MDVHAQCLEHFQLASKQLRDVMEAELVALAGARAQRKSDLEMEFQQKLAELEEDHLDAKLKVAAKFAGFIKKQ